MIDADDRQQLLDLIDREVGRNQDWLNLYTWAELEDSPDGRPFRDAVQRLIALRTKLEEILP